MSNLLSIPFKQSYPLNVKDPARNYLQEHAGVHPDEFRDDINRWQTLRKDGVDCTVHINNIDSMLLSVSGPASLQA